MKTSRFILSLLFVWAAIGSAVAQVAGVVSSAKNKSPQEGVEVFINNTTIATVTNEEGKFSFENIPGGYWEIVLYKKGFELYRSVVKIQQGKSYSLNLSISPSGKREPSPVEENENTALGVRTRTYMVNVCRFEYVTAKDLLESIRWEKNRTNTYKGSLLHWLTSLHSNTLAVEGFTMKSNDGTLVDSKDIVSPSGPDSWRLNVPGPIKVGYLKNDGTEAITTVSTTGPMIIHSNGSMLNSKLLRMEGEMTANMQIPANYVPIQGDVDRKLEESIRQYFEKSYVHTDKPYYYPGEAIWLKAYLNYYIREMSEQLSRLIYVEIINADKQIVQRKALRIENGSAWGEFNLGDSTKAGLYYLRAYTSVARNFGEEAIFVKPFHIVDIKDKVAPLPGDLTAPPSDRIDIRSNKNEYKPRERITIDLVTTDKSGNPTGANLSVSVTDAVQVVPIKDYTSVAQAVIDTTRISHRDDAWYAPEPGITFAGVFVGDKNKPEKGATLGFTQINSGNVLMAETDNLGKFTLTGLQHYDTATYFFNSDRSKKIPYGKIVPDPADIPTIDIPLIDYPISVVSTSSVQRLVSEYEAPKDVRMLKEVEVRGKRIEEEQVPRMARPFGRGDYIFTSKNFNPTHENVLLVLQGKIPGLSVRQSNGMWSVFIQRGLNSFSGGGTPVVIVDNVILTGDAINSVLANMHPSGVESVEVKTRPSAILGSRGSQGVIMVYTKQGYFSDSAGPNFKEVRIPGFSLSPPFTSPDYDDPSTDKSKADYRSIIFWEPLVNVDPEKGTARFSFYAADLPAKYRIVIEGLTKAGEPVRGEYYVTVDTD